MRVLWVKAGGLVPLDAGGRIRSFHIATEIAKRHSVTLFTFYAAPPQDQHAELNRTFDRVIALPLAVPAGRSFGEALNFARHLFSAWPYSVSKYCRPQIADSVRRLLREAHFDVLICDFVIAGGVIPWDCPTPKILFTHNVEAQIWQRHCQVTRNPLWKAVSWCEYRKMAAFEKFCLQKSDHVLTVSEADREAFAPLQRPEKITVVPTGVDTEYFQPSPAAEKPDSLVFTGAMDWQPNEDGISYFVREILPLLRRENPGVSLTIVGRHPSMQLRQMAKKADVVVTGQVEDIRPYVREAAVYIVPLRIGSGTRLKIFEAMAMGKAIVSTTLGAEGLPVTSERELLMVHTPSEFAAQVLRLLRSSEERRRLGMAARTLVEQKYSWTTVASVFEQAMQQTIPLSASRQQRPVPAEPN